ncbi:MAG: hypothetical protein ACI9H1_001364, partial [Polaribacter sp.]
SAKYSTALSREIFNSLKTLLSLVVLPSDIYYFLIFNL